MKALKLATALAITLLSGIVQAQTDTSPIALKVLRVTDANGKATEMPNEKQWVFLDLALIATKTGKALGPKDLVIAHEKLFHMYSFDDGLTNYIHEHPEPLADNQTVWRVKVLFKQTGMYKIWSDVTALPNSLGLGALDGYSSQVNFKDRWNNPHYGTRYGSWNSSWSRVAHAYPGVLLKRSEVFGGNSENPVNVKSMTMIHVMGTTPPNPPVKGLQPKASGIDQASGVQLMGADALKSGAMAMLGMGFSRTDGKAPKITPYLGALAHVVITDITGTHLMHVHPMEHNGQLMLHTTFPVAGDYRLFVQFVDWGELKTIELAVRVAQIINTLQGLRVR